MQPGISPVVKQQVLQRWKVVICSDCKPKVCGGAPLQAFSISKQKRSRALGYSAWSHWCSTSHVDAARSLGALDKDLMNHLSIEDSHGCLGITFTHCWTGTQAQRQQGASAHCIAPLCSSLGSALKHEWTSLGVASIRDFRKSNNT